jgi:molybdenum cofactor cytidylyltransferase
MITGIVLAAGSSTRLGHPKQLVQVRGNSLLRHAVECCTEGGCTPVVVVLGASSETIRPELRGLRVNIVVAEDWREGMAASIRRGIASVPASARAALFLTCDQPRLTSEIVRRLIAEFDGAPGRMVACAYGGTVGVPAVFGRDRFVELSNLEGDRGAKPLLQGHPGDVLRVPWPDGAIDLDRPGDRV